MDRIVRMMDKTSKVVDRTARMMDRIAKLQDRIPEWTVRTLILRGKLVIMMLRIEGECLW